MSKPLSIFITSVLVLESMSKTLVPDRAPASVTLDMCDCQCDGTTYLGPDDMVHGNCRSADSTGRRWCYVSQDTLTMHACKDTFGHDERYDMSKSYAACATPDPHTEECAQLIMWRGDFGSSRNPPMVVDVAVRARTNN